MKPSFTIVQPRNTAATWAFRGGRISDDPGPSSSSSPLFLLAYIVSDDSRGVYARAECVCVHDSANLMVYKNEKEENNLQFRRINNPEAEKSSPGFVRANTLLQHMNTSGVFYMHVQLNHLFYSGQFIRYT